MFKRIKKHFDNEYKELKKFYLIADKIEALDEEYFTKLLGLKNIPPSHDCLSDIYARIDCNPIENVQEPK